jgi:hypothetical protein
MGKIKKLVGKYDGKGPLVRRWNSWEDDVKRYFTEMV